MPAFRDLTGAKFNRLTAIRYLGNRRWECRCDCGNITDVNTYQLTSGGVKSCGCLQRERASEANIKDITGQRFGHLTVIEHVGNGYWKCKCDCGNVKVIEAGGLRRGNIKSCGCRQKTARLVDRTGQRYGRLTAMEYLGASKWLCKCDCGNETIVHGDKLASGETRSCGCYSRECTSKRATTHGKSDTRLYKVWSSMKLRCYQKNNSSYKDYGGRGITICDEWLNDFDAFYEWAMENGYDPDAPYGECTIDRIDVNGNYEPSNCRWVDMDVQIANRRPYRTTNKPVEQLDDDGNVIAWYDSITAAANAVGCSQSGLSRVCRGKARRIRGMRFRFAGLGVQGQNGRKAEAMVTDKRETGKD